MKRFLPIMAAVTLVVSSFAPGAVAAPEEGAMVSQECARAMKEVLAQPVALSADTKETNVDLGKCGKLTHTLIEETVIGATDFCRGLTAHSEVRFGQNLVLWSIRTHTTACWSDTGNILTVTTPSVRVFASFPHRGRNTGRAWTWLTQPTRAQATSDNTISLVVPPVGDVTQMDIGHEINIGICGSWNWRLVV